MSLTLILAVLLDHWLGEPQKHHPLVLFGSIANNIEKRLNVNHSPEKQKLMGCISLLVMVLPLTGIVFFLCQWEMLNLFIAPVIVYFCIAAKSLKQHAIAVYNALIAEDLSLAKQQVALIVSRQTDKMDSNDVRKATIESVLENGADAIFAPVFWFVIAGPAGIVLYRLSNTLDAMWGYKNQRFLYFGWAAARFDDILNWVPARLTALTYALLGQTKTSFSCWKEQAHLLDSPNAGPVMTAGAGALNIELGGPAWYHDKLKDKIVFGTNNQTKNQDISRANYLITSSLYFWVIVITLGEIIA